MSNIFPIFPHTPVFIGGSIILLLMISASFIVWFTMVYTRLRNSLDLSLPENLNITLLFCIFQWAFSCYVCGMIGCLRLPSFLAVNAGLLLSGILLGRLRLHHTRMALRETFQAMGHLLDDIVNNGISLVLLVALGAMIMTISFFLLILPPDSWDTFQYHLPMAACMIQDGNLGPFQVSYGIINQYPKTAEFFFFIPMLLTRSDHWARLVQLFFLLVPLPGLYGVLRRYNISRPSAFIFSSLSVFFITPVHQASKNWGNIDNILPGTLWLGLVLLAPRCPSPSSLIGRIAIGLLSAFLCFSMKGNGVLYLSAFLLAAFLAILTTPSFRLQRTIKLFPLFLLLLYIWSYQYIQNYRIYKNPFQPVEIKLAGKVIFKGEREPRSIMAIQIPEEVKGKDTYHALLKSWGKLLTTGDFYSWTRVGGWGMLWLFGVFPLFIPGIILLFLKREWGLLRIIIPCLILFWFMPSNWWARYVAFIFALAPLTACFFVEILSFKSLRQIISSWLVVLAIVTAGETLITHIINESPLKRIRQIRKEFKWKGPIASVDTFRKWDTESPERDAHRWIVYNLPRDSILFYHWNKQHIFHYFFYRPDYDNMAKNIPQGMNQDDFMNYIRSEKRTFITLTSDLQENNWLLKKPAEFQKVTDIKEIIVWEKIQR